MSSCSVKIKNYKCFGDDGQGFNEIKPINLIIGRNNSGKSALLDIIDYLVKPRNIQEFRHKNSKDPEVILSTSLSEADLRSVFLQSLNSAELGGNHWEFGKRWIGKQIVWKLSPNEKEFISVEGGDRFKSLNYFHRLAKQIKNPYEGKSFKRLYAERDIIVETSHDGLEVKGNGGGATNLIQNFINHSNLLAETVEVDFLNELNTIFAPDSTFRRILIRRVSGEGTPWEIYLEEETKGRIALSRSGSGLKTVILVLIFINLIPKIENKKISDYVFAFEELENNLHPALQRRLLQYVSTRIKESGAQCFFTSHSNVAIDFFSKDRDSQILHVTHNGNSATVRNVKAYIDYKGILDDLDVRASDLLQSNCIIWVEGPSDRLYVNKWIELATDNLLKEGVHYQCVSYGGRLLAHLSATTQESSSGMEILKVNRNAIILIDSDSSNDGRFLNQTKSRIISEFREIEGIVWVTQGKEIENYIPHEAIEKLYGKSGLKDVGKYDDFEEYLDSIGSGEGKKFAKEKVLFAEKVCKELKMYSLERILDWKTKISEVCQKIKIWNSL